MTKYWVSIQKFAGMEIEADSEKEAEAIANRADESEYDFGFDGDGWVVTSVDEVQEEY